MIAVAAAKSFSLTSLALTWFDLTLLALLIFGFWRGRRRGMSRECLPVLFWLTVVFAGGFGYELVGDQFLNGSVVKTVFGRNFTDRTAVFIGSYLLIALAAYIVFSILNRAFKARLEGSNAFGGSEYYLGMVAGVVRYAAILTVALALLNAPYYSPAEIAASKLYKLNTFGAKGVRGMENVSGDYIPDLAEVQDSVFKGSLFGPPIKQHLAVLLINAMPLNVTKHGYYQN